MESPLVLTREQILAYRRRVGALGHRLPAGEASLRQAAWAGLQDSMPRAALLSIHARVEDAGPSSWEDPSLVQLWGPRYSAYVVAAPDVAMFSLGRLPEDAKGRRRAEEMAVLLDDYLAGRRVIGDDAGDALGVHPNALRYGATTGTVLMRWDGARRPTVWTVPRPDVDPLEARLGLARRYLRVFGPSTSAAFAGWAGISTRAGATAFELLDRELVATRTPIGDAWLLAADEPEAGAEPGPDASARLLPSGDTYYLLWGNDRELLVPDEARRAELWTSRVWPGALLVDGEIRGTWRRADAILTIDPWGRLSDDQRDAVEDEAAALPLPGVEGRISVRWNEG
jgi:hypothetical protein